MSPCLLESPSQSQRWGNDDNDDSNDDNETQVSIPDETVKFSYDQQRQYILFQGTEVAQWSSSRVPHKPESGLGNLANAHHAHDDDHKHNGLWSQIMQGKAQTGSYMKAIVIRTGFMTTKVCLFLAYAYLSFDRHDNNCVWWSSWQ